MIPNPLVLRELREYIDAQLTVAFHKKIVDYGYWCPRCEVEAMPTEPDAELGATPGWCPLCGLDPLVEGPTRPMYLRGILEL